MKRNGPQDVCYAALYDAKDEPYIRRLFANPKADVDPNSNYFVSKIIEKYNDHKGILEIGNRKVEFTAVSKADDVVTYPGLSFCMQQILGLTVVRFKYMVAGTDSTQARPYQQGLVTEVTPRIDITVAGNGSIARVGEAMQFIGIFPASFPTATIRESAISTASPGGIYLNRNMFSSNAISHTSGVSGFTLASLITFSGVTTWG